MTNKSIELPNPFFQFKQFTVHHDRCAMKVTTDACLFGAWVANEIQHAKFKIENLLDIGAGSGLLSLMIAQKNELLIDAIEIETGAAEQAKENIANSGWQNRMNVIHQDVLKWNAGTKYDCIVSNPPFYENELRSAIELKNIAHHDGGLKLTQLLAFINKHLVEEGCFFLLLPTKREIEFAEAMNQFGFRLQKALVVKQSVNHEPFRLLIRAGRTPFQPERDQMAIRNERGNYTPQFISLLEDYYLYL